MWPEPVVEAEDGEMSSDVAEPGCRNWVSRGVSSDMPRERSGPRRAWSEDEARVSLFMLKSTMSAPGNVWATGIAGGIIEPRGMSAGNESEVNGICGTCLGAGESDC